MKKLFTALLALSFIGSAAMADDIGINALGPNVTVIANLKTKDSNATQIQFSRVCGRSNSYEGALAELSNALNYPYIALNVQHYTEVRESTYSKYLKRPYKLHEKILYTKSGWGEYNELACVLIEGAPVVR